ncbi:hypothetical protein PTTG_25891 [Puccinia triticina 1-1 BBBD Race 1]|uniref:CCHC-type domain-containing protein n=1 Tax=Puccinia triticina (isolate 1-1 / race 1 (BBBD)) TaxID=630390 RepID=A0A180GYQ6_PUCT1|nr:hypothetical protein PTTG_25891 [Puccinia triticina 1-1 BBBD Race 1]
MSNNKPPSGRFVPCPAGRPIPGLQTLDRTTPTMKSVLGPQLSSNDYFKRQLNCAPVESNASAGPSTFFGLNKGKDQAVLDDEPEETTFQPRLTGRTIGSSATNWCRTKPAPHLHDATSSQRSDHPGTSLPNVSNVQLDIAGLVNEMRLQREADEERRLAERLCRESDEARTQARWELNKDSKISTIVSAAIKDFATDDFLKPNGSNIRRWEQALGATAAKRFRNTSFYTPQVGEAIIPYHKRIAMGIIQSSVHPELSFDLLDFENSADVFDHLITKFCIVNRARQLQDWEKMKNILLSDYSSAAEALAKFDQCTCTFVKQGIELTWDTMQIFVLQGKLRDHLRPIVDAKVHFFMETHDLIAPGPIDVLCYWDGARTEHRLAKETGRGLTSTLNMTLASHDDTSVSGIDSGAASGSASGSNPKTQTPSNFSAMALDKPARCYICKKLGHMAPKCPTSRKNNPTTRQAVQRPPVTFPPCSIKL